MQAILSLLVYWLSQFIAIGFLHLSKYRLFTFEIIQFFCQVLELMPRKSLRFGRSHYKWMQNFFFCFSSKEYNLNLYSEAVPMRKELLDSIACSKNFKKYRPLSPSTWRFIKVSSNKQICITKRFTNPHTFDMTTVYFHFKIKSEFRTIPNVVQNVLTSSTCLIQNSVFSSSIEHSGVERIFYLRRWKKENWQGSDLKKMPGKQLIHPFQPSWMDCFCSSEL